MKRIRFILLFGLAATMGCASSMGRVVGALPDTSFAEGSNARIYVETPTGVIETSLDGTEQRDLFSNDFTLIDMASDGSTFLLLRGHRLCLATRTNAPRCVDGPPAYIHDAALSPDGTTVAAIPWPVGDNPYGDARYERRPPWISTVYLLDVESKRKWMLVGRKVRTIQSIAWEKSGEAVWLRMEGEDERVVLATNARQLGEWPEERLRVRPQTNSGRRESVVNGVWIQDGPFYGRCEETGAYIWASTWNGDKGLDLGVSRDTRKPFVSIEGRKRGFHDYLPTIPTAFFVDACRYIVFVFDEHVWVSEVATGKVGLLSAGRDAW